MYTVILPTKLQLPPGTVVRSPATWEEYVELADSRGDRSLPRIKYRCGEMLIMSPLPVHARNAHILARIVELLLENQNQDYEAFTPVTMRLPEESGIEPDYCFYMENRSAVIGKDRINWQTDPPPDLVIEIDVTSYSDVNDYLPYSVPEIWLLQRNHLFIYHLQDNFYQQQQVSRYFPNVNLFQLIENCLQQAMTQGTSVALRALRDTLQ